MRRPAILQPDNRLGVAIPSKQPGDLRSGFVAEPFGEQNVVGEHPKDLFDRDSQTSEQHARVRLDVVTVNAIIIHVTTEAWIGWAAGLFEGEGCIGATRGYPRASMASTDQDVIERFAEIVRVGKVSGPASDRRFPSRKPLWRWWVSNPQDFIKFTELLEPYLGERRLQKLREIREHSRLSDPLYRAGQTTIVLPIDELRERYERGESLTQIANSYGVAHTTICRRLKRAGIARRPPGWSRPRAVNEQAA